MAKKSLGLSEESSVLELAAALAENATPSTTAAPATPSLASQLVPLRKGDVAQGDVPQVCNRRPLKKGSVCREGLRRGARRERDKEEEEVERGARARKRRCGERKDTKEAVPIRPTSLLERRRSDITVATKGEKQKTKQKQKTLSLHGEPKKVMWLAATVFVGIHQILRRLPKKSEIQNADGVL